VAPCHANFRAAGTSMMISFSVGLASLQDTKQIDKTNSASTSQDTTTLTCWQGMMAVNAELKTS
jgi:hypothetical protein